MVRVFFEKHSMQKTLDHKAYKVLGGQRISTGVAYPHWGWGRDGSARNLSESKVLREAPGFEIFVSFQDAEDIWCSKLVSDNKIILTKESDGLGLTIYTPNFDSSYLKNYISNNNKLNLS